MIETARRKPRRLALSVKLMMLLIIPVAVWLAWVSNKARRQREAVKAIQKQGGSVHYNWEYVKGVYTRDRKPAAPEWLRRLVGNEYFQDVERATLRGPDVGDGTAFLAVMRNLRLLSLGEGPFPEDSFRQIGDLTKLEELSIRQTRGLSESGAKHLANLRDLKILEIVDSELTDVGLGHLAALTKLENLNLSKNNLTDDGISRLKSLVNLEELYIDGTRVTDRGLEQLKGLTRLKRLSVTVGPELTPGGVIRLRRALPRLRFALKLSREGQEAHPPATPAASGQRPEGLGERMVPFGDGAGELPHRARPRGHRTGPRPPTDPRHDAEAPQSW